jgi:glutamyl-tRNA(Gln) amidotransferase subunit D
MFGSNPRLDPPKRVHILTTGGTIMARSEPESRRNAEIRKFEELSLDIRVSGVKYEVKDVLTKGSANMIPQDWVTIAREVEASIRSGVDGVVVMHGTDTMQYTAAALSFMLGGLPIPVVLTGSMIPMGDPGTDGISNLHAAIRAAAFADLAEVCVLFSADKGEERKILIRGNRAKKIHSYQKRAFVSVNSQPLGYISGKGIELHTSHVMRSMARQLVVQTSINSNVCLLKIHPALTGTQLANFLSSFDGAVLEGTGIGHFRVDDGLLTAIDNFGKPVALSTQCLYGGERLGLYAMDKHILFIRNIIPVRDMLPEVAMVKLMWCLPQEKEVRKLMLTNIAGEIESN